MEFNRLQVRSLLVCSNKVYCTGIRPVPVDPQEESPDRVDGSNDGTIHATAPGAEWNTGNNQNYPTTLAEWAAWNNQNHPTAQAETNTEDIWSWSRLGCKVYLTLPILLISGMLTTLARRGRFD
jgi:hypothetical protein